MAMDKKSKHFIEQIIDGDLASGKHGGRIHTRFPPEPNGYLHIGHCKAIVLNFEIAQQYGGLTNLRFDDTNPVAESKEYVDAIRNDIHWLGYDWDDREFYASDYFDELYGFAIKLIKDGKAYVDESSKEEISRMRGVPTEPGEESPYRNRSIEENLRLFQEMKEGKHDEGSMVLRAKVDMSSPNMHMRDPIIYRILKVDHHRTGDKWCIYPNYDFAHGQSDSIEKITHSLCSLEFENHRPLYNWLIEQLEIFPSRQIEFARLNLDFTIMSKRKLLRLVEEGHVNGWDDPRMPTVSGLRRRGYTPDSIKNFIRSVGMSKRQQLIEVGRLEHAVREDLNKKATRRMVVEDPIVLEIENFGDDTVWVDAENNPENPEEGNRRIPVTKELLIERADFMEDPPKKFFRLGPERIVRLKHAFIIQCIGFDKDVNGVVTRVRCKYFEDSWSGNDTSGQKPKGTLHWVSKSEGKPVQLRIYDRLFNDPNPDGHDGKTFIDFINPDSLKVVDNAVAEPAIYDDEQPRHYQFLRKGYYYQDPDSTDDLYIFNRTVTLKDAWVKLKEK
jgi:glutaminyl-tRNA synthetase